MCTIDDHLVLLNQLFQWGERVKMFFGQLFHLKLIDLMETGKILLFYVILEYHRNGEVA